VLGRRLGIVVLLVFALAVGALVSRNTPDVDTQQQPFVRTGRVGESVRTPDFDARVLSVRGAAVISQSGAKRDTSGVWVLVTIRLMALHKPVGVGYMAIRDGQGHTYRASTRVDQARFSGWLLQPGIPIVGEVAFEVPVAVAGTLSIQLAVPPIDLRMTAIAEIPLAISDSSAHQWKAQSQPVTLTKPSVTS
jgi:hypothetical protein